MPADLLVATRSTDKLAEIRAVVAGVVHVTLKSLADLGIEPTPAEEEIETYPTFIENAIAKAGYFAQLTGMRTLADDSGLAVDALDGAPGVRTRRFALDHGFVPGSAGGKQLDDANNTLLLEKLAAVPDDRRTAHYVCAAALADPAALRLATVGTCSGRIARAARGLGGFGYDPIFLIPALGTTFAELTATDKNARSHRARAFRAIAPHLR